jgi:hypothetical protein
MARQATLTAKKLLSLEPDMVRAIEDFRFEARINSESEAIRRLIEVGLEAVQKDAPAKEPEA